MTVKNDINEYPHPQQVLSITREYVTQRNDHSVSDGMEPERDLNLECIKTLTWHLLRIHCPSFASTLRGLVYVIHDEFELLYIGQTSKTLVDRLSQHFQNPNFKMQGAWPKHEEGIEPQKIGYWLRKREERGSINFWLTVFPTRGIFALKNTASHFIVNAITEGFEQYLLDKLCPLLNGSGKAAVVMSRYPRYLAWERQQAGLDVLMVSEQCPNCASRIAEKYEAS
jgi:hypothetical protein